MENLAYRRTTNFVYMRHSQHDRYDYRYAYKTPGHENVYTIGRVVASTEQDAERKVWHKTTPIGQQCCITCILADIHKDPSK